jgi:hypothetical protein
MNSPIISRIRASLWLAAVLSSASSLTAQEDLAVTGNLSVTGDADINGNTLSFGTRSDSSTTPGLNFLYGDDTGPTIYFSATRSTANWVWQSNTSKSQLKLSSANQLILYDQTATPAAKITLDPVGTSTFANSVVLNGTSNRLPNQTLSGRDSILTQDLADTLYVAAGSTLIWEGEGYASISLGNTYGYQAYASGVASTAMSGGTAGGEKSVAMSGGITDAMAEGATAMSNGWAGGPYSIATSYASAYGTASTAMTLGDARADYSTAIGRFTSTNEPGQVVVGYGNETVAGGLFVVGNGTVDFTQAFGSYEWIYGGYNASNAFVIYKNGNMWVGGDSTLTGKVGIGTAIPAEKLEVVGNAKISGTLTVGGTSVLTTTSSGSGLTGLNASQLTTGIVPVTRGGTGTTSPSLMAGDGINITGTWPNQIVAAVNNLVGYTITDSASPKTALGDNANAMDAYTTAIGSNSNASGYYATAIGSNSNVSGFYATAMGYGAFAMGEYATAIGSGAVVYPYATDSANYSTAIGPNSMVLADYGTAIGPETYVSGDYTTALGYGVSATSDMSTVLGANMWDSGPNTVTIGTAMDRSIDAIQGNVILAPRGGNVGIGTTEPIERLDVAGNAKVSGTLTVGNIPVLTTTGNGGGLTGLNASQLTTGTLPTAVLPSTIVQTTAAQTLTNKTLQDTTFTGATTAIGSFGIQTSSPQSALSLGTGQLTVPAGTAAAPSYTFNNNLNTGLYSSTVNSVSLATNGVERLRVYPNGNLASDDFTNLPGATNNGSYKVFHFASPSNSGSTLISMASKNFSTSFFGNRAGSFIIGNEGARPIIFKNGMVYNNSDTLNTGAEQMRIAADGKVGIGQAAPTEKLDVVGNAKVSGMVTMNAATVKTTLRLPPSGDLSMGGFTTGTNPAN